MSEASLASINEALAAFADGDVARSEAILSVAAEESQARRDVEETFAVCCARASLAAMAGAPGSVAGLLAPAAGAEGWGAAVGYLEGVAALAKGSLVTAVEHFSEARRQDGSFVFAQLGLAACYFQMRRYKESFAQYRAVLEALGSALAPPVVRVGLGLCAFRLGDLGLAAGFLERALAGGDVDGLALLGLLLVYLEQRRVTKIAETVVRLRELMPHSVVVLLRVGDLLFFKAVAQQRVRAALHSVGAVLAKVRQLGTEEQRATADFQEGRLLLHAGDIEGAKPLLEAALRTLPHLLPARIYYARVLLLTHRERDGLQLLIDVNREHPDQREVLQLLAAYATRLGYHEAALKACRRLTETVAQGDVASWSLAAWCSRMDTKRCAETTTRVLELLRESGAPPPWQLLVNKATLDGDVEAVRALADRELGADFMERPLAAEHIPLVFNLALLQERQGDRAAARALYVHLVREHSHFKLPYYRLSAIDRRDGAVQRSVAWLTLLNQLFPDEATAEIGRRFFEERRVPAAVHTIGASRTKSLSAALATGAIYLWCSHQRTQRSRSFLAKAKDRFLYVLQLDKGNILGAHGLACCLALEGDYDHAQSLLIPVGGARANNPAVQEHHASNMANLKVLCESYQQGADYLRRVPAAERDWRQSSTLALCLAKVGSMREATAELAAARAKNPDEPMLVYNLALLHCAAFIRTLALRSSLKVEEARELREGLETGLALAVEFLRSDARNRYASTARPFIKSVANYCLEVDSCIDRIIQYSSELEREQEEDAQRWAERFRSHRLQLQEAEDARQQQAAQLKARRSEEDRRLTSSLSAGKDAFLSVFMRDEDLRQVIMQDQTTFAFAEDEDAEAVNGAGEEGNNINFNYTDGFEGLPNNDEVTSDVIMSGLQAGFDS